MEMRALQRLRLTPGQVAQIRQELADRFDMARIDAFIEAAENEISGWLEAWPPLTSEQQKTARNHLAPLAKHLDGLRHALAAMHPYSKIPLWRELNSKPGKWKGAGAEFELSVAILQAAVQREMDSNREHNGRRNTSKRELVERLAETFYGALGKYPTTTATGPFMGVMSVISDVIGEPIGKHLIADTVRYWRKQHEFHFHN